MVMSDAFEHGAFGVSCGCHENATLIAFDFPSPSLNRFHCDRVHGSARVDGGRAAA